MGKKKEHEMETRVIWLRVSSQFACCDIGMEKKLETICVMENQVDEKIENEMETGIIRRFIRMLCMLLRCPAYLFPWVLSTLQYYGRFYSYYYNSYF